MRPKHLLELKVPLGTPMDAAFKFISAFCRDGGEKERLAAEIAAVVAAPENFLADEMRKDFAQALLKQAEEYKWPEAPVPHKMWGSIVDALALGQIHQAGLLPISRATALMPDAHCGYGLPIGGVLATHNAVIPFAVGVDIACRMKLTVLDLPLEWLDSNQDRLIAAIEQETRFGVGAKFETHREHPILDEDWDSHPIVRKSKQRAFAQLGTSGSGNHFVEFGKLSVADESCGLPRGEYVALLSHSGSRGTGSQVCEYYSDLAVKMHPSLPKEFEKLAWLGLDTEAGQEYWAAMELMGRYAAANHWLIHHHIAKNLGVEVLLDIENHHNFAWRETHGGEEVIVHRKGATPAAQGVLGVIPGTMATPGYIVRGKGVPESLNSASHGAGRTMSRKAAHRTQNWDTAKEFLSKRNVTLISAGLDEVPFCYKDIETVMAAQSDLVDTLAKFDPRIVKMSQSGERPED